MATIGQRLRDWRTAREQRRKQRFLDTYEGEEESRARNRALGRPVDEKAAKKGRRGSGATGF